MAGRWRDPSAFRADPTATPAARPSRRQTVALVAVLILVAGAVAIASYVIRPEKARAFDLFHGSLFLTDQSSPVAVDLASGKPTLRLVGADKQVGITTGQSLGLVPLDSGTLLLNQTTGEFNMVDSSGFVVKHDGGGVPLGGASGQTAAMGVADGQLAYIIRTGPSATDVYLVSQATVESALSATSAVRPRASTAMSDIVASTAAGSAVAANGNLWLLGTTTGGAADQHTIRQLALPANSSTGAQLDATDHGSVSGAVAMASASSGPNGATAVGVADATEIKIFDPDSTTHTVRYSPEPGVDRILPAGNRGGRLAFLIHGGSGWSVVSVAADGTGLRGPTRIADIPTDADLLPPAYSADMLYTMDRSNGHIFRIGNDGRAGAVAGADSYPLGKVGNQVVEPASFGDAYVVARGSRVVFNSPTHANALILFTDGSHPPTRIQKGDAVNVSASGGAEQLTRSTVNPGAQPGKTDTNPKQQPQPGEQAVNNKLDCKNITQKPHIPTIDQVTPGSRSVLLHWTYPILDPKQDCQPSTYVVNVKLVTPTSPSPPSSVRVDSQDGVNLTALFPMTEYQISVTAYINEQGTTSRTIPVRTGPEGPAAPTDLKVVADASGNWQLSWNSCGTVKQGCVPAQTWTVTPNICDGQGVNEPPAPVTETADPTSRAQPPLVYKGTDSLLGAGLQFVVTGAGESQVPGTPSARSACVHSWSPPDAAAMTLAASHPANTSLSGTTSTTVSLDLGADPVRAVGGLGAQIDFKLSGSGPDQTKTETFTGAGTSLSATFPGLSPGAQYSATVTVSPPGHSGQRVTLGPQPVTTAADWPDSLAVTGQCPPNGKVVKLNCSLTVSITGLSSSDAHGETFDIIDTDTPSGVRCGGGPNDPLAQSGVTLPLTITDTLSLLRGFSGTCTVTIHLRETPTGGALLFGGVVKTLTTTYTVDQPTTYTAQSGDFSAAWDTGQPDSEALITYQGTQFTAGELSQITQNWTVTVQGPHGESCGTRSFDNPPDGVDVPASGDCVRTYGDQGGWSVHITYEDQATSNVHSVPGDPNLTGPPPSYQPCNVTDSGFTAAWGATRADPVTVTYAGDAAQISGCSDFAYTLQKDGQPCGTADNPTPPGSSTITSTCDLASPGTWTVQITWHNDDTGQPDGVSPDLVLGDPPTT